MTKQKDTTIDNADELIEQIKKRNDIYLQMINKIANEKEEKTLSIEEKLEKLNENNSNKL